MGIKSVITWIKKASRENRVWRTYWQAVFGYLAVNLATWDGSQDLSLALETLAMGSIAAGLSALWKTSATDSDAAHKQNSQHEDESKISDGH